MEKQLIENTAPHSVEISQNAKGDTSFSIKVYSADEMDAVNRAIAARDELRSRLK